MQRTIFNAWPQFKMKRKYIGILIYLAYIYMCVCVCERERDTHIDSDAGRDWGQEEKGTTEDEMAGWHH